MIIAVCIKQVVTREWQVRVNDAKTWVRDSDASWELNEPDAYALEEALRLREKHGGEVVVVSAGPGRVTQVLREAVARGADRAIHVEGGHLATADAFAAADALAAALATEKADLVLTGLQSDDQGFAQVGVVLAEKLGAAHATIIMEIQVQGSALRVKRELEGGWFQWIAMPLPAVLTIQSGINQLRYATLKGIMAAKKKEIRKVPPPEGASPAIRVSAVYFPEKGKKTQMLAGLINDNEGKFKLVGLDLSDEPYGVGLKKGDDVVTQAGILGRIHTVMDKVVVLEIASGVRIRVLKTSIQGRGAIAEGATLLTVLMNWATSACDRGSAGWSCSFMTSKKTLGCRRARKRATCVQKGLPQWARTILSLG